MIDAQSLEHRQLNDVLWNKTVKLRVNNTWACTHDISIVRSNDLH